jgi:putative phage-type endonuclease
MVGAILGLDPNTSRAEAMRRMVRAAHGAPSEFVGNIATNWGQMHETEAREDFEYAHNVPVEEASFVIHPTLEWLGASPDGYIRAYALLEIKCPFGLRDHAAPVPFKSIEDQQHYYAQMQIQMYCTGRTDCYFWQWTPHDARMELVKYAPEWIADNLPKLQAFYQEFLAEDPEDHIEERRVVIDTPRALQMVAEYDDLVDSIAKADERRKELMEEIVKMVGGKNAVIGRKKLTKVDKAGSISYASAIKVLAPGADLEKWRGKPSSYWIFK